MTIPTTAQVGAAMQHASEQFTAFVAICAFLRLGAAGGLRVSDIDFMRRQVHVQRQVQVVTGGGVDIRPPKYGRERTVYVPDGCCRCAPSMCACMSPAKIPTGGCSRTAVARRCIRTQPGTSGTELAPRLC